MGDISGRIPWHRLQDFKDDVVARGVWTAGEVAGLGVVKTDDDVTPYPATDYIFSCWSHALGGKEQDVRDALAAVSGAHQDAISHDFGLKGLPEDEADDDDLTTVTGVGDVRRNRLREMGIRRFEHLKNCREAFLARNLNITEAQALQMKTEGGARDAERGGR